MAYEKVPDNGKKTGLLIPPKPTLCTFDGCQSDSLIVLISVHDGRGQNVTGPLKNYGYVDDDKNYYLHSGYYFNHWITRCAWHYTEDMRKAGKHQLRGIEQQDHSYMRNKPHSERMTVLRNLLRGAFRPLPYNQDDDADTIEAIEERNAIQSEAQHD